MPFKKHFLILFLAWKSSLLVEQFQIEYDQLPENIFKTPLE